MSYHIVHILTHDSYLHIDRGFFVCDTPSGSNRVPVSDICMVVVAARGISFSADCLSQLMESKSIVLHCDHNYRPIGMTAGLAGVVHDEIFGRQIVCHDVFTDALWESLIESKILNQSAVLDAAGIKHYLREYLHRGKAAESLAAREYWKYFFPLFKKPPKMREHKNARHPVNRLLNYSYAVMGALVHRSILAHGLSPLLGIHHRYRFKSNPLVYDLIEPLRPVCDLLLLKYHLQHPSRGIQEWVKHVASSLINCRIEVNGKGVKLLYAVDRYVNSVANCFLSGSVQQLATVELGKIRFDERDQE